MHVGYLCGFDEHDQSNVDNCLTSDVVVVIVVVVIIPVKDVVFEVSVVVASVVLDKVIFCLCCCSHSIGTM